MQRHHITVHLYRLQAQDVGNHHQRFIQLANLEHPAHWTVDGAAIEQEQVTWAVTVDFGDNALQRTGGKGQLAVPQGVGFFQVNRGF